MADIIKLNNESLIVPYDGHITVIQKGLADKEGTVNKLVEDLFNGRQDGTFSLLLGFLFFFWL